MEATRETFSTATVKPANVTEDFSLVLGGPLFQMFRRTYLSGGTLELIRRRIIFFVVVSWVPLLLLSMWEGHAWGDRVSLPFLRDFDAHARFLVALPLLIVAELVVHQRMRNVVRQFLDRQLIPPQARAQFEHAVASAHRLRNSVGAEVLLLVFVYGIGIALNLQKLVDVDLVGWYGSRTNGKLQPTLAGWWFGMISFPFFRFLLFRWYYRLIIWARFLWQVSRIKLDVMATHPDRSGGLGFLSNVSYAFVPLLMAHGTLLAGMIANRVLYAGVPLAAFKLDIVSMVLVALIFILGPLLVFSPQLAEAKRLARREYGTLAQRYVRDFDRKWLRGGAAPGDSLVGNSDVQSLADMGNSYNLIRDMRWIPFTTRTILQLGVTTVAPLAPLLLTVVPLEELVDRMLKIIL